VEFIECYHLIRRHDFDDKSLVDLQLASDAFFRDVSIFQTLGVRKHMRLPRQHALHHYVDLIKLFGSPMGHDTAITENKHKAVKEAYRRSNRNQPMGQMLTMTQRLDKLAALRTHLESLNEIPHRHQGPPVGYASEGDGPIDMACPGDRNARRGYGTAELARTARS
jgi:hypothetical protein